MSTSAVTPETPATPEITVNNTAAEIRSAMEAQAVVADPTPQPAVAAPVTTPVAQEPQPYTVSETPEGVEIKLETGAVYKGKNWAEAAASLAKGKVEADKTLHALKTQQAPAAPATPTPTPVAESEEDVAAREWIIAQQAKAFGLTPEQYKQAVQQVFQTSQQTQQLNAQQQLNAAWMDFTQDCPDFVDTPETTQAIVDYLPAEVINKQRTPTRDDLKAAHALALYNKRYTPAQSQAAPPRLVIPPVMPTAAAGSGQPGEPDPYKMPMSELRKLMNQ